MCMHVHVFRGWGWEGNILFVCTEDVKGTLENMRSAYEKGGKI